MKNALLILCILFAGISCTEKKTTENNHNDHGHAHDENSTEPQVVLNNGAKWEANLETNQGVENMKTLLVNYKSAPTKELDKLKSELNTEFSNIFAKCTMKGEAHEQLHNYLLPFKDKLASVSDATLDEMITYLEKYHNYFQ